MLQKRFRVTIDIQVNLDEPDLERLRERKNTTPSGKWPAGCEARFRMGVHSDSSPRPLAVPIVIVRYRNVGGLNPFHSSVLPDRDRVTGLLVVAKCLPDCFP